MPKVSAILIQLVGDIFRWWALSFRSSRSTNAEHPFLRRQLVCISSTVSNLDGSTYPWRIPILPVFAHQAQPCKPPDSQSCSPPSERRGYPSPPIADLRQFSWQEHCRGFF